MGIAERYVLWLTVYVGTFQIWHKLCFKCSICNKGLDSSTVSERDGNVFCRGKCILFGGAVKALQHRATVWTMMFRGCPFDGMTSSECHEKLFLFIFNEGNLLFLGLIWTESWTRSQHNMFLALYSQLSISAVPLHWGRSCLLLKTPMTWRLFRILSLPKVHICCQVSNMWSVYWHYFNLAIGPG